MSDYYYPIEINKWDDLEEGSDSYFLMVDGKLRTYKSEEQESGGS